MTPFDADTPARLDLLEAWSDLTHATAQAEMYPDSGAASLAVAGGYAVYCGQPSPLNRACGLGMSGPVGSEDLDALEAFYSSRGCDACVRVCPHADASLVRLLGERGYVLRAFMNVYARPVGDAIAQGDALPGVDIRAATVDEARLWFTRAGYGGDWARPDGIEFMAIRTVLKPGARLYLAWKDGLPVGGGALEIHEGAAALMAAMTLPAYRRLGIHAALMYARLAAAAEAGCDIAVAHTRPGAMSQGNVLRNDFRLMYTTAELVHPNP